MDFFIIKQIVKLNYKKKLAISGIIKNDINKPMSQFSKLLINNIEIPIGEINEALISDNFYIAFTFDLNSFGENLLSEIMKLEEGQMIGIL